MMTPRSMPLDRVEQLVFVLANLVHGREPLLVVDVDGEGRRLYGDTPRAEPLSHSIEALSKEWIARAMILRTCHGDACKSECKCRYRGKCERDGKDKSASKYDRWVCTKKPGCRTAFYSTFCLSILTVLNLPPF